MKEILVQQEIEGPLSLVLRAREERFNRKKAFPHLKPPHILSKEEDEEKIVLKREFEISAIPAQFRQFARGGKFTFIEDSVWDKRANHQAWTVRSKEWGNVIRWDGETQYRETGEGDAARTVRELKGKIHCTAPIFAKKIEESIAEGFIKNFEKDKKTIEEMIRLFKSEGAA